MAQPIKIGLVNRALTCEEHDSNIDALLDRSNHTGLQSCDTIEPVSLETCVSQTNVVTSLTDTTNTLDTRLQSVEAAIQGGGSIQQDIQALRNELLNEIDQIEIVLNNHDTRITDLETRADLFDSSITSINALIAFEVGNLQTQIDGINQSINSIVAVNNTQTNNINANTSAIQQEAANRINAINNLTGTVNNDRANRIAGDNNLQTSINTVNNNRIADFNTLNNKIDNEIGQRQAQDNDIRNDFAAADLQLQNQINALISQVQGTVPAGTIVMWAGVAIPEGWLLCNGAAHRRSEYPNLFSAIGTQYNPHGGGPTSSSDFRVPNFSERFPRGLRAANQSNQGGGRGGRSNVGLSVANLPRHTHSFNAGSHTHSLSLNHYHPLNIRGHVHGGREIPDATHRHSIDRAAIRVPSSFGTAGLQVTRGVPPSSLTFIPSPENSSTNFTNAFAGGTGLGGISIIRTSTESATEQIWPEGRPRDPLGNRTTDVRPIGSANFNNTGSNTISGTTDVTGSSESFSIVPLYVEVKFIIKT